MFTSLVSSCYRWVLARILGRARNFLGHTPSSERYGSFVTREAEVSVHIVRRTALVAFASLELLILLVALTKPAYGYVDPGSGLLAVQVGGSMLAGGLFILRTKIRRLFRLNSTDEKIETETSAHPESE
ncbi:MAG: hypothetical protein ABSG29_14105 [Steroidobacteraceae bacterium]|jgi:hypothetical protein